MSDITDRVNKVLDGFDARVQAASAEDWSRQSPCEEWTARDVVVHVGNNLHRVADAVGSGSGGEIGADEDITAAWVGARDRFREALSTGDLTATVPTPFGPMPAEQFVGRIIATDVLVHTWDLARAIGADESLDPHIVEGAYSGLKPLDAMIRQPGVFGPKRDAPAGADTQTEFLCFLGRAV